MLAPINGNTAPAHPRPPSVDAQQVDTALRSIRADVPVNQSRLADVLRHPDFNQAERTRIIQTLAREDGQQIRFYANDAARSADGDHAALSGDQQVIADAVQAAYDEGAINADDLVRIADVNEAGNGAQRFMQILENGARTRDAGGICEALADALWARNGEHDRAVAATVYTDTPDMMARNLGNADLRTRAFEALVEFNQAAPYEGIRAGVSATLWESGSLSAVARLFDAHADELVAHYTSAEPGRPGETEVLAEFMSQTLFNPDAQGIMLDRRRDLVPAVRAALGGAGQALVDRAADAPVGSDERARAMRQFGQLTASMSAGAAVALDAYSDAVAADEASRKEFSKLVGATVSDVFGFSSNTVKELSKIVADRVLSALADKPDRPDAAVAGTLFDEYASQVDLLADGLGDPDLMQSFESGYAAELLNLQQNLDVNLGGHAS